MTCTIQNENASDCMYSSLLPVANYSSSCFILARNIKDCVKEIVLFELESVAGCKLRSAIHFSECCWERDRKPSGTAAELSPLLPRAGPGSVLCTPLWAADKVCPGHRDAHRGERSQFCVIYCLTVALASPAPLKWKEDWFKIFWARALSLVTGRNLLPRKQK